MGTNTSGLKPFSKDDPERARAMQKRSSAKQKENNFMKKMILRALQSKTRSTTILSAAEEHGTKKNGKLGEIAVDAMLYSAIVEHNEKAFRAILDYSGLYEKEAIPFGESGETNNSVEDLLAVLNGRKIEGVAEEIKNSDEDSI